MQTSANSFTLRYFKTTDFDCTCGCGQLPTPELMTLVDNIRRAYGKPITVSSGARCEAKNTAIKGAKASWHVKGLACDLVRSEPLRKFLEANMEKFGYCLEDPAFTTGGWLHVDLTKRGTWRIFKP